MAPTIWLLFAFCLLDMALAQPPPPPPPNQNQTTPRPSPMVMGRPQQNSGVQQQPAPMPTVQSQNQNNDQNGGNAGGNASSSQMVQFQQGSNNGCPPIFGQNFPRQQQTLATDSRNQCQWVIISDRNGCPTFFQNCGSNPPMCNQQNEIWWQCTSQCEPSCGNPTPNCRQNCGRSGCQCFPGFLRNQNGFCVNSNQCPSADQCDTDDDCDGDSMICRSGQCQQGCTSNNACQRIQQCRSGRCVDRGDCQRDNQCRDPKICIFNQCRFINSLFCRSHFDCPGSSFCGRNGRCQFSFRSFDQIPLGKVGVEKGFF